MLPPLRSIAFAAMSIPFKSKSPSTTVYLKTLVSPELNELSYSRVTVLSLPPLVTPVTGMRTEPVTVTVSLKAIVTVIVSPAL